VKKMKKIPPTESDFLFFGGEFRETDLHVRGTLPPPELYQNKKPEKKKKDNVVVKT